MSASLAAVLTSKVVRETDRSVCLGQTRKYILFTRLRHNSTNLWLLIVPSRDPIILVDFLRTNRHLLFSLGDGLDVTHILLSASKYKTFAQKLKDEEFGTEKQGKEKISE